MATWRQIGLQDAGSPVIEELIYFHDFAMVVLCLILRLVGVVIGLRLAGRVINKGLLEGQLIEGVWTVLPALVLVQLAVPSLLLLYTLDERHRRRLRLKAIGHQWYWSYEYSDFWGGRGRVEFDSYIAREEGGQLRLLEVDNRVVLPFNAFVRVLVGSRDVLHAWTVPSLGVKADACPGRLNQVRLMAYRPGVVYGQCSEICGANHRFMPIGVEFVSGPAFLQWLSSQD